MVGTIFCIPRQALLLVSLLCIAVQYPAFT